MINITKERLLRKKLVEINKQKNSDNKIKKFFKENQAIILLVASFLLLAISNGFLVYNFFKTLSKL